MKKLKAWSLILLLFISLIPALSPIVQASHDTWYVSRTGSDSNAGDISHPFRTLQKAINISGVSDTIYLREGNYNSVYPPTKGWALKQSGTASAWFTLSGYPGETAILNGAGHSLARGYSLLNVGVPYNSHLHQVRITNLVIENVTGAFNSNYAIGGEQWASKGAANSYIRIDNCTFNNCQNGAVRFCNEEYGEPYINNVTVENCTVYKTTYRSGYMGECISFSGCKYFTCKDNVIDYSRKTGIIAAAAGQDCSYGNIFRNTVKGMNTTLPTHGIYLNGGTSGASGYVHHINIYNNLLINTNDSAVCLGAEQANGGVNNVNIYNNIINITESGADGSNGMRIQRWTGYTQWFSDITIKYNTFHSAYGHPLELAIYRTQGDDIYIVNNIFEGSGSVSYLVYGYGWNNFTDPLWHFHNNLYDHTTSSANTRWRDGTGKFEATAVIASPLFVNRKAGNFYLKNTSPAIDAADSTYTVSTDYDGHPRPQNGSYDIGAYEYYTTIIPALSRTFLIGMISHDYNSSGSIISIKAKLVLYIRFNPFSFNILSSNETIFVSKENRGYIGTKFIIGVFNAAALTEKGLNIPLDHQILDHLKQEPQ